MMNDVTVTRPRYYNSSHLDVLTARAGLDDRARLWTRAVAAVLPFRVNDYVVEELIDWDAAPDDPIYRLVFPQPEMLPPDSVDLIAALISAEAPAAEISRAAHRVRIALNPHPAGQTTLNVPTLNGKALHGIQHKYLETVLFFPQHGQTCHTYCTYCFRWPQFVPELGLKIAGRDVDLLCRYLRRHREVTSVLITGGDPMVMTADILARYLEPLINDPQLDHIESIRIGTKALSYWPQRFVFDRDADATLKLFEMVVRRGLSLAVMAHFTHPRELEGQIVQQAVGRILETGAVIRTQSPMVRRVNDDPATWATMWRQQVRMGMVPYYMFVERDTGPRDYFAVPLVTAHEIFTGAYASVSGLCRTVRGPVMSATPGKVVVDGLIEVSGDRYLLLRLIQSRDPSLVNRPFLAQYDDTATWLSDLRPPRGRATLLPESMGTHRGKRDSWVTSPKVP